MGSIPVYLIHYLEFIILHFGMCIRKRRTCTFVTTTLYLNMVGFIAGSRPPYPWFDLPKGIVRFTLGSDQLASVFSLSDHAKFWL